MRMVRSLYARSKLEKYHESTNVYRQKIYLPKAKVRLRDKVETKTKPQKLARRVCSHEKKGLRSREKGLHLTRKKGSSHERKLLTWIFTRPLVVLVRTFSWFLPFNPNLKCFERPTLRGLFRHKAYISRCFVLVFMPLALLVRHLIA